MCTNQTNPKCDRSLTIVAVTFGFLLIALAAGPSRAETGGSGFQIVVHESNPVSTLDKRQVSRLFLKRARTWENRERVEPVDQAENSDVRELFTDEVHGRSTRAIKSYWLRMIFTGEATAPPEVEGDAAVLAYIASNASAIGYVRTDTDLPAGVKAVSLAD